jgi:hypothetical protein
MSWPSEFDENQLANHIPPPLGAGRVVSIDDDSSAEASSDTSSRDGMIDPQGPQDDAQDPPDDEAQDFPDGDAQDPPEDPSHPNPRYFSVDNISIEAAKEGTNTPLSTICWSSSLMAPEARIRELQESRFDRDVVH